MLVQEIKQLAKAALSELLPDDFSEPIISQTRKEFEGDYTLVVFPYVKALKRKPEDVGDLIGKAMMEKSEIITGFNVVKGFLNLSLSPSIWAKRLEAWNLDSSLPKANSRERIMVEYCSPNTNKPIHLGHMRNILLGWSTSCILKAAGFEVIRTQIINDRGIAICKSMLAWKKFGEGKTPESEDIKGDYFVGHYYVLFEKKFQEEYKDWQTGSVGQSTYASEKKDGEDSDAFFKRYKHQYFNEHSNLGREAKEMLRAWEAKEKEVYHLWQQMNQWVYDGFEVTYDALGVDFDKIYYESDTYLLGKEICDEGLEKGVFYRKDDGSVWADLTDAGMDEKIVLRADGTALYITQDLGTAEIRYKDYQMDGALYVVADEQDYHFQVLFELLKRLGRPYADTLHHLSYGMVDLPSGKMKSREGTVVDADELMQEVIDEAAASAKERGELDGLSEGEINDIHRKVGMGALKFFILKVNPKKRMTFDPKESLDMQGQTGPYVQNAFVRIASVGRKSGGTHAADAKGYDNPSELEKGILKDVFNYPSVIEEAASGYDPSQIANYCYQLAKDYHRFYHEHRILTAETEEAKSFRLALSEKVQTVLEHGMGLLGIEMPQKM
jgi:arginyl-tRNA synthetase